MPLLVGQLALKVGWLLRPIALGFRTAKAGRPSWNLFHPCGQLGWKQWLSRSLGEIFLFHSSSLENVQARVSKPPSQKLREYHSSSTLLTPRGESLIDRPEFSLQPIQPMTLIPFAPPLAPTPTLGWWPHRRQWKLWPFSGEIFTTATVKKNVVNVGDPKMDI